MAATLLRKVVMTEQLSPTLTVPEAAQLLGISTWLAFQAVRRGELPSVRLGRRILIPRARLHAWLAGQAVEGNEHRGP